MTNLEEPLSIVEQWNKKCYEMSSKSNDNITSLLSRGINTMAVVLDKKSDVDRVQRALSVLEYERSLTLQFDNIREGEVRFLVYGLIESLHFTLSELTKERNQVKECGEMFTQTDQIPNVFELIKEEPFDESFIKIEDYWGDEMEIKDEEMENDDVVSELNYLGAQRDFENEDVDETINDSKANEIIGEDREKSSLSTVDVENKRRLSRKVSRPLKFLDCEYLEYFNGNHDPTMKKSSRTKISKSSGAIEKNGGSARSNGKSREIKCTECEYQTTSAGSFTHHLRYVHFTTLGLSGLALRCDCGVEVLSFHHEFKCDIANFTVVQKRDGPIHRIGDEKTTPQCILCEAYPKTACGYITHLQRHHKSYLSAHGIYLQCSCGTKYHNYHPDSDHTIECTPREYTLHKVADM